MKKKHRDITVDGVKYGWIAKEHKIGGIKDVSIYKDKKVWFTFVTLGAVEPSAVSIRIKNKLKSDTPVVATPVKAKKAAKITAKAKDSFIKPLSEFKPFKLK